MIVIQRPNGPALYLLDDGAPYSFVEDHLVLPDGTLVSDVSSETSEVATGVAAPPIFVGGAMLWSGGTWSITDQAAYDAAADEASHRAAIAHAAVVSDQFASRLAAGFAYQGQIVDIDAEGRADLDGMALTAALVGLNQAAWPAEISEGWVNRGNTNLPLPTPADGLALATAARTYYSALVRRQSALLNDPMADPTSGWPSNAAS